MEDTRFILEEAEKEEIKHQQKNRDDKKERRDKDNQSRQNHRGTILFFERELFPILCKPLFRLFHINDALDLLSEKHGCLSFLSVKREMAGNIVIVADVDPLRYLFLALLLRTAG